MKLSKSELELMRECDGVHDTVEDIISCKSCAVLLREPNKCEWCDRTDTRNTGGHIYCCPVHDEDSWMYEQRERRYKRQARVDTIVFWVTVAVLTVAVIIIVGEFSGFVDYLFARFG